MTSATPASPPTAREHAESVVLLDEHGHAIGTADKIAVHSAETPLHLAFSCYLFDAHGNVLVTRRALDKRTFPGVWTNSCCGHPAPGEALDSAVRRRVEQELGTTIHDLRLVLPRFRYRAEQDGIVENEMCPVYVARSDGPVSIDPVEVDVFAWEPWHEFRGSVLSGTRAVSVWCREQVEQLPVEPWTADPASTHDLPLAAREGA
jgi:isopentenyl-diphosphate delta-isomerase